MEPMTFLPALVGGILIGLSASLLLLAHGRVAGISSIVGQLVTGARPEAWGAAFLAGMVGVGAVAALVWPAAFANTLERSTGALVVAGLLVGFGTRLGQGCTSGHGVCGLSRGSSRSLAAVLTFMGVGALTATLVRLAFGGVV